MLLVVEISIFFFGWAPFSREINQSLNETVDGKDDVIAPHSLKWAYFD